MAAVIMPNSVKLFGINRSIGVFDRDSVVQMLDRLAEQEKELHELHESLLKERNEKNSLQEDFEHVLMQLKFMHGQDNNTCFSSQADVMYI